LIIWSSLIAFSFEPCQPKPMAARLDLRLVFEGAALGCDIALTLPGSDMEASVPFASPLDENDAEAARWLLEDYPRVEGPSSQPLAETIENNLLEAGRMLGEIVFGATPETTAIASCMPGDQSLSDLCVTVTEPPGGPWIPWELLTIPGHALPLSLEASSFSRLAGPDSGKVERMSDDTLRVLLVVARPAGESDVPFRSVAGRVVAAAASSGGAVVVDILRPATFAALADALARAGEGAPYDVVHFDGHGVYRKSAFSSGMRGFLCFEGPEGGRDEVDGHTVGRLLVEHHIPVLLLNACRSSFAGTGNEGSFGSLASEALAAGLPAVLAMSFNIYVVTAAQFVADTYAALAAGRSIAEAVTEARRRRMSTAASTPAGRLDWAVPVLYDSGTDPFVPYVAAIPSLPVAVGSTTAPSERFHDPDSAQGPRDHTRTFFGRDGIFFQIERAIQRGSAVELVGVARSGKSALAADFGRWWCATGGTPGIGLVVDVSSCDTFEALEQLAASRRDAAGPGPALWLLDGTDPCAAWSPADQERLVAHIAELAARGDRILLTSRAGSGLPGVERLVVPGLGWEERRELALDCLGTQTLPEVAVPLLEWTDGIPELVLMIEELIALAPDGTPEAGRELLADFRTGLPARRDLGASLLSRCGLEIFDIPTVPTVTPQLVLQLYQSLISINDWTVFAAIATGKGLALGGDAEAFHTHMAAAIRAGLACRIGDDRYQLHPLAPASSAPSFSGVAFALANKDEHRMPEVVGFIQSLYCQAVSVVLRSPISPISDGNHGQNIVNATAIALWYPWWGLALPLMKLTRDALIAEGRQGEYRAVLEEALTQMQRLPPQQNEMGPESLDRHLERLNSDAVTLGVSDDLIEVVRAQAHEAGVEYLEMYDESGELIADLGRNRRYAELVAQGDAAVKTGSPDCIQLYESALEHAGSDPFRIGEVQLALARAYRNVESIRDLSRYESFARMAVETGTGLGKPGEGLVTRAKHSLGTAILDQLEASRQEDPAHAPPIDPDRLREAEASLTFVATSKASEELTRTSALNSLGVLSSLREDDAEAAAFYLQAAAGFEHLDQVGNLLAAQTNAARSLALAGRREEAMEIVVEALSNLNKADEGTVGRMAPILDSIVRNLKGQNQTDP
jgi:tetratricopeptide (TPR) repeat protein